jgi:hypothetical protein
MKNVLVFIMISLFFGCNKKNGDLKEGDVIQKPYVISQEDREFRKKIKKNKIPYIIIPDGISVESNLIIDEHSNIYYYQRTRSFGFGNDYQMENDSLTRFLNLQPKDLIKMPKDCLTKIIEENVISKEKNRQILIMASQTDTIKDQEFLNFLHHLKVPIYIIRRTTQEEDTVLKYKILDKYYNSKSVKWDKTKIKFIN